MLLFLFQDNGYWSWRWRRYISASTNTSKVLPWEAPSRETLFEEDGLWHCAMTMRDGNVEQALQCLSKLQEASWSIGLPESLSYMASWRWLQRACDMVLSVYQINSNLLNCTSLMRLALALARDQMPVLASTVLRIILESRKLSDVDMLSMSFLHMLKSQEHPTLPPMF
jgi:hypothetical protein